MGGHFVPFGRIATARAGNSTVGHTALERRIDFRKGDTHRLGAEGDDEIVQGSPEGADLMALQICQIFNRSTTV
jgi:hypothetical protein